MAVAVAQPGNHEARERARPGDDAGGMLLGDAIAAIRVGQGATGPWQTARRCGRPMTRSTRGTGSLTIF
jgi:hypothetical protein